MKKLLLVAAAFVALAAGAAYLGRPTPPAPVPAIDLDRWRELSNVKNHPTFPTGFDTILISRIPSALGRKWYIGVTVNGVSPCTGSGVCRQ